MQVKQQLSQFLLDNHRAIVDLGAFAWTQQARKNESVVQIILDIPILPHVQRRRRKRRVSRNRSA